MFIRQQYLSRTLDVDKFFKRNPYQPFKGFSSNVHPYNIDASGWYIFLGELLIEFIEDEDDGYRSYMNYPHIIIPNLDKEFEDEWLKPQTPIYHKPYVLCLWSNKHNKFEGLRLLNPNTGRLILEIGTDHNDDYYPFEIFNYFVENIPQRRGDGYGFYR